MEQLGRFPLSVILSYLNETEGCSLLLTRRSWAFQLLPIFRIKSPQDDAFGGLNVVGSRHPRKHRHHFRVVPIPDPSTRLDRVNTRRWKRQYKAKPQYCNKTTRQIANEEWNRLVNAPTSITNGQDDTEETHTAENFCYPPLLKIISTKPKDNLYSSYFQAGITALVSYPRSGNTLLRTYLEHWTGLVTGSDTRPDRTLSQALANQFDLVGEGVVDALPFCKTHWPERIGCLSFVAKRAILLVRNPFDAMDSCWNLNVTNTHTLKVTDEVYHQFQDFYQDYIRNEMKVWCQFHQFWLHQPIPILLVRYEDLLNDPQRELSRILDFVTLDKAPTASFQKQMQQRLSIVLSNKHSQHGYNNNNSQPTEKKQNAPTSKPKSIRHGRSLKRYSNGLIQELHDIDSSPDFGLLYQFGYHVYDQEFPKNALELPPLTVRDLSTTNDTTPSSSIRINNPQLQHLVRPKDCPFGRNMRTWRRQHTKDDTEPFPTVARNNQK